MIKEYLLSVVAVCMICAVANVMVKNQMFGKVLRLVSGVLILLVVIAPLLKVDLQDISNQMEQMLSGDSTSLADVKKDARVQFAQQVKNATEKHIEQIASRYGMTVQATVTVDDSQIPTPIAVELTGTVDPNTVGEFMDYISQNIGISKENQRWRDYEAGS